jgi:hypothetical protein
MKLGKREFQPDHRDLKLSKYMAPLPTPPAIFGFGTLYEDWGMLGNDRYGDCVFAGADHETMVWNKLRHGIDVKFSPKDALADYGAVTGFNPDDPNSDQGTDVRDAMKYRKATGLLADDGKRHKIAAYVQIDPSNWDELVTACFVFGCVGIGIEFPDSAMDQFNQGQMWDVVDGAQIEGGHYVPVVGSRLSSEKMTAITWGRRQEFTKAFYERYCDEAWAMLSEEQIRSNGEGLHGLNLDQLKADLAAL